MLSKYFGYLEPFIRQPEICELEIARLDSLLASRDAALVESGGVTSSLRNGLTFPLDDDPRIEARRLDEDEVESCKVARR